MEFIHSVLAQDIPILLATPYTYDLPVNPLSHTLLTVSYVRTGAAAAALPLIANTINQVARIEVLYKGSAIFTMSGWDAVAAGLYVADFVTWGVNMAGVALEECSFTFCIPHGRILYNPAECFPASTRGELTLQVTFAVAGPDVTSSIQQIETIELPAATPANFLKMTTLSVAIPATGILDVPLPIGNPISDLVLWGATIPAGVATDRTLHQLQVLVDNKMSHYGLTNYETHHNMAGRLRAAPGYWGSHTHYTVTTTISSQNIPSNHLLACYSHLPFDIFKDGAFALQTKGKSDVVLRVNTRFAVAIATTARVIPCEIVPVASLW